MKRNTENVPFPYRWLRFFRHFTNLFRYLVPLRYRRLLEPKTIELPKPQLFLFLFRFIIKVFSRLYPILNRFFLNFKYFIFTPFKRGNTRTFLCKKFLLYMLLNVKYLKNKLKRSSKKVFRYFTFLFNITNVATKTGKSKIVFR